jgi:trk system potassium uptake protein TrkA
LENKALNILIVGCGRLGSDLAYKLFKQGHRVTVIDKSASSFQNLPPDFIGITLEDDALARDVLDRAGIEKADVVLAVSNSDSVNAVIGRVAVSTFRVPRVVVRVYDPKWQPLYQALELPVVNSLRWESQRVEELIAGDQGRAAEEFVSRTSVFQVVAPPGWKGLPLEAVLPENFERALAVVRSGQVLPASRSLALKPGDQIYLTTGAEDIEWLQQVLSARPA